MRILRLARLVRAVRPLYILVSGVFAALQGVFWVLVLTVTLLYAMGILATRLIGHGMIFEQDAIPNGIVFPFKTVPDSMFTLFRVMCGEPDAQAALAIDELMREVPCVKFAFVYFLVTSSWTLLSILTAVVSDNMMHTTGREEEAYRLQNAEEERQEQISSLKHLFQVIDKSGNGVVEEAELREFLANQSGMSRTTGVLSIPARDVREVLQVQVSDGRDIRMSDFVERLVDSRQAVTEKSMMKLEARLAIMQKKTETLLDRIDLKLQSSQLHHGVQREGPMAERMAVMLDHLYAKEQRNSEAINALQESSRGRKTSPTERDARGDSTDRPLAAAALLEKFCAQERQAKDAIASLQEVARRSSEALDRIQEEIMALRREATGPCSERDAASGRLMRQLEVVLAAIQERGRVKISNLHLEAIAQTGAEPEDNWISPRLDRLGRKRAGVESQPADRQR